MMKSSRDDSSSKEEPLSGGTHQRNTFLDAVVFLKKAKDVFHDKKEMYDEFLEVILDFRDDKIDIKCVIARVNELFKGHKDLIMRFNTFVPKEYKINPSKDEQQQPPLKNPFEFAETAYNFVDKVRTRFQDNDCGVYKSFIEILKMYGKKTKSITKVYLEVAALFNDHADLLEEFTSFFPHHTSAIDAMYVSLLQMEY